MNLLEALLNAYEDARLLGDGYVRIIRKEDGSFTYKRIYPASVILRTDVGE